jgi:hypothetical protein
MTITQSQPRIPAVIIAPEIAHGTAVEAFDASSEIWTQESKPPMLHTGDSQARTINKRYMERGTDDESESIDPSGNIFPSAENVLRRITFIYWGRGGERRKCRNDDRKVGKDKDVLQSGENTSYGTSKKSLKNINAEENGVDLSGRSGPITILGNRYGRGEHQRTTPVD